MAAPLSVSILIPAYRAARHLPETLESVRRQTYVDWELLVLEDGHFDHTADLVESFGRTVKQPVRLFRNAVNGGVSRARNRLLDEATGQYIAFLDADDLWPSDYLASALARLAQHQADWQVVGAALIDEQGHSLGRTMLPPLVSASAIPTALLRQSFILPSAVVARQKVFAAGLRFDDAYPIGEDLDLWIRVIKAGFKPLLVAEPVISYRKHRQSATANAVRFPEEFSRVFEKYLGDPIVDQRRCRAAICGMLTLVARMTWKREPERALQALARLRRHSPWHLPALPWLALAKLTQRSAMSRS